LVGAIIIKNIVEGGANSPTEALIRVRALYCTVPGSAAGGQVHSWFEISLSTLTAVPQVERATGRIKYVTDVDVYVVYTYSR